MILIDTGATYDMINRTLVQGRLPQAIRDLIKPTKINTTNGKACVREGIRVSTAPWTALPMRFLWMIRPTSTQLDNVSPTRIFYMDKEIVLMLHLALLSDDHHL